MRTKKHVMDKSEENHTNIIHPYVYIHIPTDTQTNINIDIHAQIHIYYSS